MTDHNHKKRKPKTIASKVLDQKLARFNEKVASLVAGFLREVDQLGESLGAAVEAADVAPPSRYRSRDLYVAVLARLAIEHCGYGSERCDCKFRDPDAPAHRGSEQTLCPELRTAALIFAAMTEEDFAYYYERATMHGIEHAARTSAEERGVSVYRATIRSTIAEREEKGRKIVAEHQAEQERRRIRREERKRRAEHRSLGGAPQGTWLRGILRA